MTIKSSMDAAGYAVLDEFIGTDLIDKVRTELEQAFSSPEVINVDDDGIRVSTINGDDLLTASRATGQAYRDVYVRLQGEFGQVIELSDNRIGISSNRLSTKGDAFRLHFDRNQLTVVIYVTESPSFPLVLYPLVREDPRVVGSEAEQSFVSADDLEPVRIDPKPGRAVVFWGRRTLHGIRFEPDADADQGPRYSLQFAFDLQETDYSGEKYYGR